MSHVLVDSSVWVDFFRDSSSPHGTVLDHLLEQGMVCTASLIKAEIIPSALNKKDFNRLRDLFQALPLLEEPKTFWNEIILAQFALKQKGIHGIGIPDLMIAVLARTHEKEVFTKDRHFDLMKKPLGLKLFGPFP